MSPKHSSGVRFLPPLQGTILRLASGDTVPYLPSPKTDTDLYLLEATAEFAADRYRIVPVRTKIDYMHFYYVYVLRNKPRDFIYIGYSEDLRKRVAEHNEGKSKSTKHYTPLELIHYEAYKNIKDAKRREEYLKTNRGRTTLLTMLKEYFSE